jgi:hypothetical protein
VRICAYFVRIFLSGSRVYWVPRISPYFSPYFLAAKSLGNSISFRSSFSTKNPVFTGLSVFVGILSVFCQNHLLCHSFTVGRGIPGEILAATDGDFPSANRIPVRIKIPCLLGCRNLPESCRNVFEPIMQSLTWDPWMNLCYLRRGFSFRKWDLCQNKKPVLAGLSVFVRILSVFSCCPDSC